MKHEILLDFQHVVDILVHWGSMTPTPDQLNLLANYADELLEISENSGNPHDRSRYMAFMFLMYSFNLPPDGLGTAYEIILNVFAASQGVHPDGNTFVVELGKSD